jgi:CubicO group peptidase (beta-lactamase class C family)
VTRHPAAVLDALVASGRESGGAVAVVRDGVLEVDASAGTSDGVTPWRADTLVMTFSVAKPFAALAVLDVVADGRLGLDEPVASVWPEYARAGKQHTTLRHVLSHQAGLPTFPEDADRLEYDDREALVDLLARATPIHPPGAGVAEHALTYGHLLDEIVRRATGEPLAERFARIASDHGWDLHLRVPEPDLGRVATLVDPDGAWESGYLADPRWGPALGRPHGLLRPDVLNSTRFRRTSFPAVALHATADALAFFYDDVVRPDGQVARRLGEDLWAAYVSPAATGHDVVLDRRVIWTLGFQLDEEDGRSELGMGGAGGCSAWGEAAAGYGAAFVTRRLGGHDRGEAVWESVLAHV